MTARTPSLIVEDLGIVTPAGKTLLEDGAFALSPGEVVLLVGPSGSGKSTIINVLSGLLGDDGDSWRVTGTLHQEGQTYDLARERCDVGGLVFQGNALFDDLTAAENIAMAIDHTGRADPELVAQTAALLADLDPRQTVASSSGGQRQRIAIARTLLANRPLLLFDEPNSGLDRHAALKLAMLIRDICRRMGRPAIVVAHHFDDLLPLADSVLLLDPSSRRLRVLPPKRAAIEHALEEVGQAMEVLGASDIAPVPGAARNFAAAWTAGAVPRSPSRWFLRYLNEYFWILCASPLMLMYTFAGATIVGFVTLWFGFNYELLGDYVRSFVHDDALMGIGFIEATVAVPLITCILMVARNNAVITADLGNRVLSSQFRAMRNLHVPGRRYLTASIMINMVGGALILAAASMAVASWTSFKTWQVLFPDQPFELWREHFFHGLFRTPHILWRSIGWVSLKTVLSVACAGWIAIRIGMGRQESVISINYAIARSIVVGVSVTLLIHAVVAVLQF
ncbi:MAG: ATP-binding cassette domain-containing protein [Magnetospirillum sp. WYHS-4]